MNKKQELIESLSSVIDRNIGNLSAEDNIILKRVKSELGKANSKEDIVKSLLELAKLITIAKDFWDKFL